MIDTILLWLGAGDKVLAVMGPSLTILFSLLFGGATAQFLKFPVSQFIADVWFSWTVRAIAVTATALFAHVLSDTLVWPLEIGLGVIQLAVYHAGLSAIRHYWPWIETKPMVGALCPPDKAYVAAAQRAVDKASDSTDTGG